MAWGFFREIHLAFAGSPVCGRTEATAAYIREMNPARGEREGKFRMVPRALFGVTDGLLSPGIDGYDFRKKFQDVGWPWLAPLSIKRRFRRVYCVKAENVRPGSPAVRSKVKDLGAGGASFQERLSLSARGSRRRALWRSAAWTR